MRAITLLILLLCTHPSVTAENWDSFRGPTGDGVSRTDSLPLEFGEDKNVIWKTELAGKAWSSPVVWGDQVWLTNAPEDGKTLSAICINAKSGQAIFDEVIFEQDEPPFCIDYNSYASCTPAIEAGRVYVHFGSQGTACIDTKSLQVIWKRTDLECDHFRAPGSSPILDDKHLYINFDGFDVQYVVALNKTDGTTVWKHTREVDWPKGDNGDWKKAYGTPQLINHDGRRQLVSSAAAVVESLDPQTGQRLWFAKYGGMNAASRPIYADGLVIVGNGHDAMIAVRPEGEGDISDEIAWMAHKGVPKRPGPIVHDGMLFLLGDKGVLVCSDLETNTKIWSKRLDGQYDACPLLHDGRIYCFAKDGEVRVVAAARDFKLLAKNEFADGFMASPAVYQNSLILRSKSAVYRVGKE